MNVQRYWKRLSARLATPIDPFDDAVRFVWRLYLGRLRLLIVFLTSPFWLPFAISLLLAAGAVVGVGSWSGVRFWLAGDAWLLGGLTSVVVFGLLIVNSFIGILFLDQTRTKYARSCQQYLTEKYDSTCLDHIRHQAENQRAGLQVSSLAPVGYFGSVWAVLAT